MRSAFQFSGNGPNTEALSLAPGFSPVIKVRCNENRFNGFPGGEPKPLKRLFSPAANHTGLKPGANEITALARCSSVCRLLGLIVTLLLSSFTLLAQQPTTNDVRFRAVDIYVDSKDKPLAAYQLEFSVTNGNAKIVGIEGGEHPAFREAPYYDPKAIQQERVIIAAYSTERADNLPRGKTRVATVHLQLRGTMMSQFTVNLQAAANEVGAPLQLEVSLVERTPPK